MKDEQSAVAEEGKGEAEEALTARRQLSALQAPFLQRLPGAAHAETASREDVRSRLERISSMYRAQNDQGEAK